MNWIGIIFAAIVSIAATLVSAEEVTDTVRLYNLGAAHMNKNQYDEALPYFEQVLRRQPNNARAHYNLGVIYMNKDRQVQALHHFEQVSRLEPDNARSLYNLGVIHLNRGEYDHAIRYFEQVVHLEPDNVKALYNLGIIHMQLGDYDEAGRYLAEASSVEPEEPLYDLATNLAIISSKKPPIAKSAEELFGVLGGAHATTSEDQHQAEVARSVSDLKNDLKTNYPLFDTEEFKCRSDIQKCKEFGYPYLDCELTMIVCLISSLVQVNIRN